MAAITCGNFAFAYQLKLCRTFVKGTSATPIAAGARQIKKFEHKSCKAELLGRINAKHFFVPNFSIFESGAIAFAIRFVLRLKFFRKCRRLSMENYLPQAIRGGFVCFALSRKKKRYAKIRPCKFRGV